MARWWQFGEVVDSGQHRVEMTPQYNFEDYPPGTRLPDLPMPDVSHLSPIFRFWVRRRWRKMALVGQAWTERARDDYFRRKHPEAGSPDAG